VVVEKLKNLGFLKVTSIYVVVGWVLIQFADIRLETFDAPDWIMRFMPTRNFSSNDLILRYWRRARFSAVR